MMDNKRILIRFAVVALTVCLTGPALGEWKALKRAQGNNCGVVIGLTRGALYGGSYGDAEYNHQFPRGSGNIYICYGWAYGLSGVFDLDNDGACEDTNFFQGRGWTFRGGNGSLESLAEIEALAATGEDMYQATNRIEHNRVWSSVDEDDLKDWPPEFSEGRTTGGEPVIHGAETICVRYTDAWRDGFDNTHPLGASLEQSFYFLNFAESNNMIYGHIFIRNMSEYVKWNPLPLIADRAALKPDGYTWIEWTLAQCTHSLYMGGYDEGWIYHPRLEITGWVDINGVDADFTPTETPIIAQKVLRPPSTHGETMRLTNVNQNSSDFGWDSSKDVMENGFPRGIGYRWQLGVPELVPDLYPGLTNPFTGKPAFGYPGRLDPDDTRYDQWLWGHEGRRHYTAYGVLHDMEPRDSCSFDFVYMFVPVSPGAAVAMPSWIVENMDDLVYQSYLAPVEAYAAVAEIVSRGAYVLPQTPTPPPLTVIPGDRQVTITWSDVNIHTPDKYYYKLQELEADPEGVYREYDFEGYRLYRSFVGPSDSHSEVIYECSISEGNLSFFFVDKLKDDIGRERMRNGLRVWYALAPYDRNYDAATGNEFSLPDPTSGKVWNRPGAGLYTVIPRSEASNFVPASFAGVTFIPASTAEVVSESFVKLTGDGSGKLTESPKLLEPLLEFTVIPVNSERITQDLSIYVSCSDMGVEYQWCNWNRAMRYMQLVDAGGNVLSEASPFLTQTEEVTRIFTNPPDDEGINYSIEMLHKPSGFGVLPNAGTLENVYFDMNQGGYTGGTIAAQVGAPCKSIAEKIGTKPGMGAWLRTAVIEVTWKAAGDDLSVDVVAKFNGVTIPFGLYPDDNNKNSWGFMPAGTYGSNSTSGDFYEEIKNGVPPEERSVQMLDKIPAGNTDDFALWVNALAWGFSGITSMPASGTVMTITICFGTWNDEMTEFTQTPDPPYPGDKWQIDIKAMSMEPEDADLEQIRVVPNPYIASSFLDLSPSSRRIEFVNLPDRCSICIYSLGGNLVNVLNHIGTNRHGWGDYLDWDRLDANSQPKEFTGYDNHGGTEAWNLRNRFGQTVASGLYFYHVTDARGKTLTGKFYVVN